MVQWLGLLASAAEGMGSILIWELRSRMPHGVAKKKKRKLQKNKLVLSFGTYLEAQRPSLILKSLLVHLEWVFTCE